MDPRTEAELGIGTFSVRQAGSPGFQSHTEHLTQKHPDSVWWQGSGGWNEGWGHPGLPVIDAGRQFFPAGARLCLALLDMPPAPSPNPLVPASLHGHAASSPTLLPDGVGGELNSVWVSAEPVRSSDGVRGVWPRHPDHFPGLG